MKKLLILIFVILLSFTSCGPNPTEPVGKYKNFIIQEKYTVGLDPEYKLGLESDTSTVIIYVFKGTYDIYEVGDTIK